MVRGGLSSVSYRNAAPKTVIELTRQAALGGIEWTADTHAPHGDLKRAETLMMATLRAGLTVTSYGSFYRLGRDDAARTGFASVLETARRLQAPAIRVWAPAGDAASLDALASEGAALAEKSGKHGITLCVEPHEKSVVGRYRLLAELLRKADNSFLKACWTRLPGEDSGEDAARELAPHLALAHLRRWSGAAREPEGADEACWLAVAGMAECNENSALDRWAVIEYLEDERPETLKKEAEALAARLSR